MALFVLLAGNHCSGWLVDSPLAGCGPNLQLNLNPPLTFPCSAGLGQPFGWAEQPSHSSPCERAECRLPHPLSGEKAKIFLFP